MCSRIVLWHIHIRFACWCSLALISAWIDSCLFRMWCFFVVSNFRPTLNCTVIPTPVSSWVGASIGDVDITIRQSLSSAVCFGSAQFPTTVPALFKGRNGDIYSFAVWHLSQRTDARLVGDFVWVCPDNAAVSWHTNFYSRRSQEKDHREGRREVLFRA